MKRVGILYGGGHISSFMAGTQGVLETLPEGYELIGFVDGYKGLKSGEYVSIKDDMLEPEKSGIFLGSSRERIDAEDAKKTINSLDLCGLIVMGGNDHLGEAYKLYSEGIDVVGWPKTMDNDLSKTEFTLGFPTAVDVGSKRLRNAHSGAITHKKIYFVPVFGRSTDWVASALYLWGCCDLVILGEQTNYTFENIVERVGGVYEYNGKRYGKPFAVVVVAEGANIEGLESHLSEGDIDPYGNIKIEPMKYAVIIKEGWKCIAPKELKHAICIDAITYELRNSAPTESDKMYAKMAGIECANMIISGDFGKCPIFKKMDGNYVIDRANIYDVSIQRFLRPEGWADYEKMKVKPEFGDYYKPLFGEVPNRDEVVFKALRIS